MQDSLFGESDSSKPIKKSSKQVEPVAHASELITLAQTLPTHLRLGTSSWNYPGWVGMVWDREYPENNLSRYGLSAYSQHPLFKTVSIDRGFYRPMSVAQFAEYAAQVDEINFSAPSHQVARELIGATSTLFANYSTGSMDSHPALLASNSITNIFSGSS